MTQNDTSSNDAEYVIEFEYPLTSEWGTVREDLGLNPAGPERIGGIEIVEEERQATWYNRVVLSFDSRETIKEASDRLRSTVSQHSANGAHRVAEKVQNFASALQCEAGYDCSGDGKA